ncbi:metal-dependent hydrolase [Curvibacter sp. PAE-UM]|uniref:metal-dependent hydrolase n=1 Tax=Curvibacter sp. PAE-UM TaxID=1714344 RepID=UPI0009EC20FA|nr:metal-dependent hydrolase [Curvibacter sp. PAE-UM]
MRTPLLRLSTVLASGLLLAACAITPPPAAPGAAQAKAELLWLGQSTFRLTTPSGKVIVTDPWLRPNPKTPAEYKDLARLGKVDLILVTHGHGDHIADAPDLALMNKARVIAPGDLNMVLNTLGVLPPELTPRMNKSGTIVPFPDVPGLKITMVKAEHSSLFAWKNPQTGKVESHYGGEPVGFIIELENGQKIYHMGDTGLFGDMKFIGEYYKPDVLLIPIGGNFTTAPVDAAYATREFLKPRFAIPMHYGTNPLNRGTPQQYMEALGQTATKVIPLEPGEKFSF